MSPTPSWVKQLKPSGPQGHELLKLEREKSNVPVTQLSEFLHGKEGLQRTERMLEVLKSEPVFDKSQNYFAGRVDRFETALARAKRLQQLRVERKWSKEEFYTAVDLIGEPGPYSLHEGMFLVSIIQLLHQSLLTNQGYNSQPRYTRAA
jgi:acyl-CoA oxidase